MNNRLRRLRDNSMIALGLQKLMEEVLLDSYGGRYMLPDVT